MLDLIFQEMIKKNYTIEQPTYLSYKDKETLDFELLLEKIYYTNLKSLHIRFPIRIRKPTNATANLAVDLIPVTNFFGHWFKEIDITKYGTNKSLIRTTSQEKRNL